MATNGVYTIDATALGLSAWGLMGSNYYTFAITSVVAPVAGTATAAATPATFQLTATAAGNQAKDTQCALFTLTSTGAQTATNTGCW
jgi:Tfp pilus assembly protein PilE